MVVKPVPWHVETEKETKNGKTLVTALSGGYLTDSVDVYYRYRLLSSKNPFTARPPARPPARPARRK
jgi:hypothetical protein